MDPIDRQISGIASAGSHAESERVAALDGLRGFAVLWVMLYHFLHGATHHHWMFRGIFSFIGYGYWGVDVFFVLSGFLITGILYDTKKSPNYFSAFYARRSLRIFPLYYCVLLAVFVVLPIFRDLTPEQQAMAQQQGWLWTYLGNIAMVIKNAPIFDAGGIKLLHFWSLAIEEQFYLVWPAVVLLFSRKSLLWICAVLISVAAISRFVIWQIGIDQPMASFFTFSRVDGLAMGAMAALIARGTMGTERMHREARVLGLISAVALLAILFAEKNHLFWSFPVHLLSPVRLTLFTCVLVVAVAAPMGGWARTIFSSSWLRFFGKYSYALYVFHYMMMPWFEQIASMERLKEKFGSFVVAVAVRMIVCTALSLLAAILSWHLLEKHFIQLKRFFVPGQMRTAREVDASSAAAVSAEN
jgi:peptidoglycan/LPS O-acetylase OafA/YrhL